MGAGIGAGMGTGKFVSARPGRPALHPYFCHGRELFLHARLLTHTLANAESY